jgi:hypothetical protein
MAVEEEAMEMGRHGARLKELLLAGSGGSVSQMPYAPEGATGIRYR